jgi:hypothetical protein
MESFAERQGSGGGGEPQRGHLHRAVHHLLCMHAMHLKRHILFCLRSSPTYAKEEDSEQAKRMHIPIYPTDTPVQLGSSDLRQAR